MLERERERERERWNGQKIKEDGIPERHGKEEGGLGTVVPRDYFFENDTRLQGLTLSSQNTQTTQKNVNKWVNYTLNSSIFSKFHFAYVINYG